jgi:hypothetical protein
MSPRCLSQASRAHTVEFTYDSSLVQHVLSSNTQCCISMFSTAPKEIGLLP